MGELKPGWRRVKFGQVVRLVTNRCDPVQAGIERFVGLEHLEPGDLRIRSWGEVADGTTFTNRFSPGQVLFGKRRAYQRKVAVPDFEGVCSGDIYVLESANPDRLLPELLPFLCQTDAFFEHAVGTSAGSLSPRTNWTSLAEYEFALPPPEEQRLIWQLLTRSAETIASSEAMARSANCIVDATLLHLLGSSTEERPLQAICRTPVTYGIVKAGNHIDVGIPYVRVADITASPRLSLDGMLRTAPEISQAYGRTILEAGDIVIAVKASRGVVGQVRQVSSEFVDGNISRDVARIAPYRNLDASYIYWALRSPYVMRSIQRRETGWKGDSLREITIAALRTVPVPWLPEQKHQHVGQMMNRLEEAALAASNKLRESKAMHRLLLTRVFRERS